MKTSKELRQEAWNALKVGGNYWKAVGGILIWFAVGCAFFAISFLIMISVLSVGGDYFVDNWAFTCLIVTLALVPSVIIGCWLYGWASLGFMRFWLAAARGEATLGELRLAKAGAWRYVDLLCWKSLYIFLGILCLILPGILMALDYSQAQFLLVDHPELSPRECMAESKRLMFGHRWRFICFHISYIGWILLAMLANVLGNGIGQLFLLPYLWVGSAKFYEDLRKQTI